jgi:hypothetical protein
MGLVVITSMVILILVSPTLRAQNSTVTIRDQAEFNSYQMATSQTDTRTKASQLEGFLQSYPQSVVKQAVLDMLVDTYQGMGDPDKTLSATSRLLQMDTNNLKAILYSVYIKYGRCAKSVDQTGMSTDKQTCDDAATLATKGLTVAKPAGTSSDDWKKLTGAAFPIFHSAIALDDMVSKKDIRAAQAEYKAELMLYTDDQSKSSGLNDTLLLAQAYSQPGTAQDLVQACWFYARVWDYAPPQYQAKIEPQLERFYKKFHGSLDGLDAVKAQAAATTFPPATFVITPAPTPAEIIHQVVATTPDLTKLNLEDKEYILANGSKEDVDKLRAALQDQVTPDSNTSSTQVGEQTGPSGLSLAAFENDIEAGREISFPIKYNYYFEDSDGNSTDVGFEDGFVTLSKSTFGFQVTKGYKQSFAIPPEKILELVEQPQQASRVKVKMAIKSVRGNKEIKQDYYFYGPGASAVEDGSISCGDCGDWMDILYALLTNFRSGQWVRIAVAPEPTPEAAAPPVPPQHQYDDVAPPPTPPAPAPTLNIGERKAQVLADFGEPQRKAVNGPKEIYFYTDLKMKIVFTNGKVSNIE